MTPKELCEHIASDKAYEGIAEDNIWTVAYYRIKALAKEALSENDKDLARWYEKGRESVKRENQSGCCCIIDDNDKVVSACGAHLNWFEEHKKTPT